MNKKTQKVPFGCSIKIASLDDELDITVGEKVDLGSKYLIVRLVVK